MDRIYQARPNRLTLNVRVAFQVLGVTIAIYLTGWGPVLWAAYIFIALENMSRVGSRVWKAAVIYSIAGMVVGQFALTQGWLPSELSRPESASLTVMGAFVLFFVIRMAAAIMEQNEMAMAQKEEAETTLRLSEDRFRSLIQNSSDVTMILGDQGVFRYVSPAIKDLLQYEPEELIGRLATDFVQHEDLDTVLKMLGSDDFQAESAQATLEFRMLRRDGTTRDVEAVVSNQTDRPSVAGYVSNIRDVTERKKFEALLAFRALHDPLTGLANRQLILDRAQQMLVRARRTGVPVAALFIDLDNFKDSNDSLGHGAGDKLLQMVAGRLLGILRSGDTVGRLGGDEFVILAEGVSFARGPEMIAERVHEVLKPAFHLPGVDTMSITVSASIGIAVGRPPVGRGPAPRRRHRAVRAKGAGRDQSVLFEYSMQSAAKERSASSRTSSRRSGPPVQPALPPDLRPGRHRDPGRRGAAALGAPAQGHHRAQCLHPHARRARPHRRRRPLGAQRVVLPGRGLARGRGTRPAFRSTSPCASSSPTSSSKTSRRRCSAAGSSPACSCWRSRNRP